MGVELCCGLRVGGVDGIPAGLGEVEGPHDGAEAGAGGRGTAGEQQQDGKGQGAMVKIQLTYGDQWLEVPEGFSRQVVLRAADRAIERIAANLGYELEITRLLANVSAPQVVLVGGAAWNEGGRSDRRLTELIAGEWQRQAERAVAKLAA